MAKKTSSVNLENKIWDEIKLYMEENGLENRKTAIEWMILERRALVAPKTVVNVVKEPIRKIESVEEVQYQEEVIEEAYTDETIDDIIGGIPD